ncbi:MAG: hypothetical protein ACKVW3_03790 [Phycisphaerales bacterium]
MNRVQRLVVAAAVGMMAASAVAGPPLLCFPYQCDETVSLAETKRGKDHDGLVERTIKSLDEAKTTLGKMETIRRAVTAVGDNAALAHRLHERLLARALDASAEQKDAAGALFVAGMWVATITQAGAKLDGEPGERYNMAGMAWVERAIEMDPGDAAKSFGAAVIAADKDRSIAQKHLKRAVAGAEQGSALARSIETNLVFGGKKIDEMRKDTKDETRAGK